MKAKQCFYPQGITPFNKNSPKFGKAIFDHNSKLNAKSCY